MKQLFVLTGSVAGVLGVMVCASSGLARIMGYYYVAGLESTTIFNAGVGLMVFACMLKLEALLSQSRGN